MKICILTHTIPRYYGDPSAPFMDVLANALSDLGHKVTVLAPYDSEIDLSYKRKYRLKTFKYIFLEALHLLGYSRTLKGDKSLGIIVYLLSPFFYFFGFLALLRLTKKEKFDTISAHWIIPNGFIAALVSVLTKTPFTVTIPGSDIYLGGKNFFFKWMVGFAARRAAFVISDSSHYLDELYKLGFKPDRDIVIRYGVDVAKLKSRSGDKISEPVVIALGRMVAKKGFKYLVKAMPLILKKNPRVRFLMVGDGEQKAELESLSKKLEIEQKVIFAGRVLHTEVPKYLNMGDVFVAPSIKDEKGNIDASPVSMMEAMACGLPVVTTKFGGSNDLVISGKTGYLVPEKDAVSIAEAVIKLLAKRNKDFKKDVRKIAIENFSSKKIAQKYTNCFESSIFEA